MESSRVDFEGKESIMKKFKDLAAFQNELDIYIFFKDTECGSYMLPLIHVNEEEHYFIFPFREIGRLSDYTWEDTSKLAKSFNLYHPHDVFYEIFSQIYEALLCLHSSGFVYNNLLPKNVVIDPSGKIYLNDFSNSHQTTNPSVFDKDINDYSELMEIFIRDYYEESIFLNNPSHVSDLYLVGLKFPYILKFISWMSYLSQEEPEDVERFLMEKNLGLTNEEMEYVADFVEMYHKSDDPTSDMLDYLWLVAIDIASTNSVFWNEFKPIYSSFQREKTNISNVVRKLYSGYLFKKFELFINTFDAQEEQTYLSGIVNISHMKGEFDGIPREIYFFGDFHAKEGECLSLRKVEKEKISSKYYYQFHTAEHRKNTIRFTEWMENVLSDNEISGKNTIDFYFEASVSYSPDLKEAFSIPQTQVRKGDLLLPAEGHTMDVLRRNLWDCYNLWDKSKCPYKKSRIHFVDVRSFADYYHYAGIKNFEKVWTWFWKIFEPYVVDESDIGAPENVIPFLYDLYIRETKIGKQWFQLSISEEDQRKILAAFYESHPRNKFSLNEMVKNKLIDQLQYVLLIIYAVLVDMYSLGRMFKPYSQKILFYAGFMHNASLEKILSDLFGFKSLPVNYTPLSSQHQNQCLNISLLPYPLFAS